MQYKVVWTVRATKQVAKIPHKNQLKIKEQVDRLTDSETWGDVRKLVNHEYEFRLRVGEYRVLFDTVKLKVKEEEITVLIDGVAIEEVKKRDDRTY